MKILFEQIEFEDWASTYEVGAMYKERPFTGTAYGYYEDIYFEWNYKDGRADGRWFKIKKSSRELIADGFYINALKVGIHKEFCSEFEIMTEHCDGYLIKKEIRNLDGILLLEYNKKDNIDREYYDDGTLYRNTRVINHRNYNSLYLGDEQNWLSKDIVKEHESSKASYRYERIYNQSLFFSRIHYLEAKFHISIISRFCEFLLENNQKEKAKFFFIEMMNHKNLFIQNRGAYYAGELKNTDLLPYLKEFILNKKKESKHLVLHNRFSKFYGGSTVYHRTSKIAKEALEKIKLLKLHN